MRQDGAEHPVGQDLQFPGGIALLQGPDGRGGKERVPQGGVADEQDTPDRPKVHIGQGPGRPLPDPAGQVEARQFHK